MKILTERLIIRDLCEADYPEFERILNDVQKTCFGSGNILSFIAGTPGIWICDRSGERSNRMGVREL